MPRGFEVLNTPYCKRIPYGMMDFVSVREDDFTIWIKRIISC